MDYQKPPHHHPYGPLIGGPAHLSTRDFDSAMDSVVDIVGENNNNNGRLGVVGGNGDPGGGGGGGRRRASTTASASRYLRKSSADDAAAGTDDDDDRTSDERRHSHADAHHYQHQQHQHHRHQFHHGAKVNDSPSVIGGDVDAATFGGVGSGVGVASTSPRGGVPSAARSHYDMPAAFIDSGDEERYKLEMNRGGGGGGEGGEGGGGAFDHRQKRMRMVKQTSQQGEP